MTENQIRAARENIHKAIQAAQRKQTLKHLPKKQRTDLAKQAAKVKARKKGK